MVAEIFPNPTVKEVAFEIRYPNLFSIENRIGDVQEKIMHEFPESKLILRRHLVFADVGPEGKLESLPPPQPSKKIWHFESKAKHEIDISTSSLSIVSKHHKTYNNPGYEKKFRDVIDFVLTNFLQVISIPIIQRIGLRYIDECPLPLKDNKTFKEYYNSSFPIDRYPIDDATFVYFQVHTKRGGHNLIYKERLVKYGDEYKLILDFDGFETDVPSKDSLRITDELHEIIETEYFSTIREPVKQFMRRRVVADEQTS